ncbi:MAG: hypothetical protein A3G03_00035 [Candidatus Taylorbacteria bacterium RIFCSPLOWO2_12_FULL_44_15c]|uniref:Uncharacterized protein n=1 Tax=Candidatus Taylorbacteria bacterium RIFCSPLOWO2_12_FULL_44_15c TaxID=1802333 RepID=A0A1G2P3N6_9BACT|nr:MAG: hypothetical protein A3I97_02500 [Candidatus Taylorbacteria bacterium RIFCSPLOWO2_02_FULL_44_35]OHA42893.1 MAG: hypothetical protein A3G03_00035 [Candidatus Taylorbacteria bacterium RIFCSPLOWO2_12_FULL_44_15c]
MKKLSVYEEQFRNAQGTEAKIKAFFGVAYEMIGEINELRQARRAQCSDAILAVIKDIVDRWERFCERVGLPNQKCLVLKLLREGPSEGESVYQLFVDQYPGKRILSNCSSFALNN